MTLSHHHDVEHEVTARPEELSSYFTNPRDELAAFLRRSATSFAGRVLEVGCAAGSAAPHWRALGASVLDGIELHPVAGARARAGGCYDTVHTCTFDQWREPENRYDAVIFADVLEHLADPVAVLRRVHGLLEPEGGQLVLSLPNVRHVSVLAGLIFLGDWRYRPAGILDRTHLRFFTSKSARRLLEETGFEVVAFERFGSLGLSRRVARVWPWMGELILSQFFVVARCTDGVRIEKRT